MTAEELEQKAERAVRRGELLAALELYETYLAQHADDERIRSRMESVRALLQPSELVSRRRADPEEPEAAAAPVSDAEQGEVLASSGRFADAAKAYERAAAANPTNELLRERLQELRALAQAPAKADLQAAEKLEDLPGPSANGGPTRSARAHAASFAPLQQPAALPRDPKALLEELLERVRSGRK
jgi:tetratricopeptide (TPR) repeat protein